MTFPDATSTNIWLLTMLQRPPGWPQVGVSQRSILNPAVSVERRKVTTVAQANIAASKILLSAHTAVQSTMSHATTAVSIRGVKHCFEATPYQLQATPFQQLQAQQLQATTTVATHATTTGAIRVITTSIHATTTASIRATTTVSIRATTITIRATTTVSIHATTVTICASTTGSIRATTTVSIRATTTVAMHATIVSIHATTTVKMRAPVSCKYRSICNKCISSSSLLQKCISSIMRYSLQKCLYFYYFYSTHYRISL